MTSPQGREKAALRCLKSRGAPSGLLPPPRIALGSPFSCLPRGVLFQGLLDGNEVLEALGHLEALDVEVTRVQEVVHPLPAVVRGLGLSGGRIRGGGRGGTKQKETSIRGGVNEKNTRTCTVSTRERM